MLIKSSLFLILQCFILSSSATFAQTNETIRSGRPGQAIGAYVVGNGYFQIQSGIDSAWASTGSIKQNSELLNNVLRYGLTETFEVSGVFNLQQDRFTGAKSPLNKSGISDFHLGFRYNVTDHPDGLLPGIGLQTRFKFTNVSKDYRNEHPAPVIIVSTNHKLNSSLSLNHNFGVSYDGVTAIPTYLLVSNLGFPIGEKWGGFVEAYGHMKDIYGAAYVDTGAAYLINPDFQFDASAGWGNNRGTSETFVSVGLSWRAQTLSKTHLTQL